MTPLNEGEHFANASTMKSIRARRWSVRRATDTCGPDGAEAVLVRQMKGDLAHLALARLRGLLRCLVLRAYAGRPGARLNRASAVRSRAIAYPSNA